MARTNPKEKMARRDYDKAARQSAPGEGGRFAALEHAVEAHGGVRDAGAVAAAIGRKKYGKARFQKMAAAGKKHG